MTVTYWTGFSKRKDSTKQPTSGTDVTVVLKDDCSRFNPTLKLKGVPITADYFYISEWERYYFVNNAVYLNNDIIEFTLEVDVLASFKTDIGNTVAPISFSSSGYDTLKIDHRLPVKTTKTITASTGTAPGNFDLTGCFILTVINSESNSGMTCQYAVDAANMQTLAQAVFTNAGLKTELKEYLTAPFDAIISCKWMPLSRTSAPGGLSDDPIKLGSGAVATSAVGRKLSSPCIKKVSVTESIPWTYSDFRRAAPYTTLDAWIPGYGFISLNASDLTGLTSLKFEFCIDWGSGDVCCNIMDPVNGYIFQSVSYNIAVSVPIANITLDVGNIISSTNGFLSSGAQTAMSIGAANVAGGIAGAFSMISNGASAILSANKREYSSKGGIGGRATIWESIDVTIYCFSVDTEDPNNANYIARIGRPVGVVGTISSYSGYIECEKASCSCAGTATEKDRINSYLNTGFYYE